MKDRNKLGYRIRQQREALGLSKSEFSRRVGVTPTAVHNWEENGVVPRAEMMLEIAKVLRVEARDLTGRGTQQEFEEAGPAPVEIETDRMDDLKREIAALFGVTQRQVQITITL